MLSWIIAHQNSFRRLMLSIFHAYGLELLARNNSLIIVVWRLIYILTYTTACHAHRTKRLIVLDRVRACLQYNRLPSRLILGRCFQDLLLKELFHHRIMHICLFCLLFANKLLSRYDRRVKWERRLACLCLLMLLIGFKYCFTRS